MALCEHYHPISSILPESKASDLSLRIAQGNHSLLPGGTLLPGPEHGSAQPEASENIRQATLVIHTHFKCVFI